MKNLTSDELSDMGREYSLYTISDRGIPHISDGLKNASRRLLWTARDGSRFKTATLAGAALVIHPHGLPESAANTLAAFYGNNIPLMDGDGAFGTLIDPTEYGATRYTHTRVSQFTKDCLYVDIDIIPHKPNYDNKTTEPVHFLPLVPLALLNAPSGVATGFTCSILPRNLDDIIKSQIAHLSEKNFKEPLPYFVPTDSRSTELVLDKNGNKRWKFTGSIDVVNTSNVVVTNLPYSTLHKTYITKLHSMKDRGDIVSFDDNSSDAYKFNITFKRGSLKDLTNDQILNKLNLVKSIPEQFNVIDFDGQSVLSTDYVEIIQDFTDWRLTWYKTRYENLRSKLNIDIQRYRDVIRAINKNVGGLARKIESRSELIEVLEEFGIVELEYIANLPIYRFTQNEKEKTQQKLDDALEVLKEYNLIIKNKNRRVDIYTEELKQLLSNSKKGKYLAKA